MKKEIERSCARHAVRKSKEEHMQYRVMIYLIIELMPYLRFSVLHGSKPLPRREIIPEPQRAKLGSIKNLQLSEPLQHWQR